MKIGVLTGDEMNAFLSYSQQSRAELEYLAATEKNMIGVQSSSSLVTIVQDSLLASFLMTRNNEEIPRETFLQLTMMCDNMPPNHIQHKLHIAEQVYKKFNKNIPLYCGKTLFSLLLPDDLVYSVKNKAVETEPIVKVYKGIIYEGAMNKVNLKGGFNSLISLLHKEYSSDKALEFVNNVQFLANQYMLYHGFSIGIGDCVSTAGKSGKIKESITKCFMEAQGHEETTSNPIFREARVNMSLSKARDIGMRIAKESLDPNNNFISTVMSGSKGDYFNIAQIMGLLGQQNITGQRVQPQLNNGTRTLPHYPIDVSEMSKSMEYESRGFIQNSFVKGLSPQEFWFHAMSGREGICDTSLKTASSGYIQRKMVKIMEDVQVKYDQTVRNSVGSIVQFAYGDDNMDGAETIIVDGGPLVCNLDRLANQLNAQHEIQHDII